VLSANSCDLLADGNSLEDVEYTSKYLLGMKIGILEISDLVGLDFCKVNAENITPILQDGAYSMPEFFLEKVRKGHLGVKTGKGYYDYSKRT